MLGAFAYELSHEQLAAFTQRAADKGACAPTDDYLEENAHRTFVALPVVTTIDDDMLVGIVALGYSKLPERLTVEDFFPIDGTMPARAQGRKGDSLLVFLEMPEAAEGLAQTAVELKAAKKIRALGLEYLAGEIEPHAPEAAAKMRALIDPSER